MRRLGGRWKEAGQDGTSSHLNTRQSSAVSCLMLVVFGRQAAKGEGSSVRCGQRSKGPEH